MADAVEWYWLGHAVDQYAYQNFAYKEVPWLVEPDVSRITCKMHRWIYATNGAEDLVGSGEQGFLQLHVNGALPLGKYVTCTPCFRREDNPDRYHLPHFMKVELFNSLTVSEDSVQEMIDSAFTVMTHLLKEQSVYYKNELVTVTTEEGFDILLNGIEVGSYGIRNYSPPPGINHEPISWVYGTGLALPRFSQATKHD